MTLSAAAVTRLLGAEQPQADWFAPEFLAQVPFETIKAQLAGIRQAFGGVRAAGRGAGATAGRVRARHIANHPYRRAGLPNQLRGGTGAKLIGADP